MSLMQSLPTEAELNSYQLIAKIAATNPHWKKLGGDGKPDEVVATILSVMLLARELGFSPMLAVSGGINNIKGKFEISARLMNQAIRSRGHKLRITALTNELCTIWGERKDTGEKMEVSYHIEEARRSGLIRPNGPWTNIPQDMLFARTISRLARRLYPDCIGACYVEGELQETILKISPESVDMPNDDEIEIETEVQLKLPEDICPEKVEIYLKQTAEITNISCSDIKKRASENLSGFLATFRKWEQLNYPEDQELMVAFG